MEGKKRITENKNTVTQIEKVSSWGMKNFYLVLVACEKVKLDPNSFHFAVGCLEKDASHDYRMWTAIFSVILCK